MLAAAIDAVERLFMQQADQIVLLRYLFHDLHGQLVVIRRQVGVGKYRSELMLRRSDFIMLGLGKDAELPELLVQIMHKCLHSRLDRAEVMILHLLTLGGHRAEEGTAAQTQVFPLQEEFLVDQEVLLLRTDGCDDTGGIGVAHQRQHTQRLLIQDFHGTQQRRLLIQRFSAVGVENGRNI